MDSMASPLRFIIIIAVAAFGVFIGFLIIADAAEAAQPVVTITVDSPVQEADVAPGKPGLVRFTGSVDASQWDPRSQIQQILVSLDVSAGGWPATISPENIVFDQPGTKPFAFTVKAPPRTSHAVSQEVTITGQAQELPGLAMYDVSPSQSSIVVKQFYKFSVECSKPFMEVAPGKQVMFTLVINNEGNYADTFKINIDNKENLADAGWTVQLSSLTKEILEGEQDKITLQVTTPTDWVIYTNEVKEIDVKFYSFFAQTNEGLNIDEIFPIFVRQKGTYIPGFEPFFVIFGLVAVALFVKTRYTGKRRI